jgi:hypothetical protein
MATLAFRLPDAEHGIIWRYLDGVSQALARRFEGGSMPGEENLTFLLCELLDDGMTGLHLLDYPLSKAREDLADCDAGLTLDVSFQTHEHTKHVEHYYSGADLGVVFVVDHPCFGRSEKAVLLQAKKLFPNGSSGYTLNSAFNSFHADQRDKLKEIEQGFSAGNSIFYLWYSPRSEAFSGDDGRAIRALEATTAGGWRGLKGWHPLIDEILDLGWPWHERNWPANPSVPQQADSARVWRASQPATRISALQIVDRLTASGHGPRLTSLYQARSVQRKHLRWPAFEPMAELFLLGLMSDAIGHGSDEWLRLARGEKVALPPAVATTSAKAPAPAEGRLILPPKHTLTLTLRSSLSWPDGFRLER